MKTAPDPPRKLQIGFKPSVDGDYERAMVELVKVLSPIIRDCVHRRQYVIVPTKHFDVIKREWVGRLDAVHISDLIDHPSAFLERQ